MKHDIAFIIVTWNARELLLNCLESLYNQTTNINSEVFVIDNASLDGTVDAVKQNFSQVKIIENRRNLGFAAANNRGLSEMSSRYAVLLNNDTIVQYPIFGRLLQFMDANQDVAVAGPQLINRDGSKQNCFHNFPSLITELFGISLLKAVLPKRYPNKRVNFIKPVEVDSILGACFMIRREAIDHVGQMDSNYFFFLEETDWCFRLKENKWKVYHIPDIKLTHLHGETSKKKSPTKTWIEFYRSNYRFFRKNRGISALLTVRLIKFLKLHINLVLMLLLSTLLFFSKKKYNQKLITYATLLIWHYKLCPETMGLKNRKES